MTIVSIKKAETKEQIVWAEVYAPLIPDSDGEFMTADTIKVMAYKFMTDLNLKNIDVQHDNVLVDGACVVESFIARKGDDTFIEGAWVVGVHVNNPDTWAKIENQEINGFSLEALVNRTSVYVDMQVPPVIGGNTSKYEDHQHNFFVTYDHEGTFLGGMTDEVNGHTHQIRRGTITEKANNHEHKFDFVDTVHMQLLG